jgi:hypothetical protein
MALWGNNDNIGSTGTVALTYSSGAVVGTATSFGIAGGCSVGDVIRFGARGDGGSTGYFGDAVIISIASSEALTIGSTMALSGEAISGVQFQITQLPKSSILDVSYSDSETLSQERGTIKVFTSTSNLVASGAGVSILALPSFDLTSFQDVKVGDFVRDGSFNREIIGLGTGTIETGNHSPVGFKTVFFDTTQVPGISAGDFVKSGSAGTTFTPSGNGISITSVASTFVVLDSAITATIGFGTVLQFISSSERMVSLGSTLSTALTAGQTVQIARHMAGYDKYLYGVDADAVTRAEGSSFDVTHAGWVGVTTYIDNHGNFRVKKETLVAMSGISTGNAPIYDSDVSA